MQRVLFPIWQMRDLRGCYENCVLTLVGLIQLYKSCFPSFVHIYFIHTVIKEGKAGILVTDKRTFLNEANEHLGFGHQGVELLMRTVSALQEPL